METAILLVLLTLNPAGQTGVNFVMTDDMETCEGKTILLKNILTSGGIRIIENKCVKSPLKFSTYSHRPVAAKQARPLKRHTYLVRLDEISVTAAPMKDMNSCKTELATKSDSKTYCATSVQSLL